jgi:hypothetical protein
MEPARTTDEWGLKIKNKKSLRNPLTHTATSAIIIIVRGRYTPRVANRNQGWPQGKTETSPCKRLKNFLRYVVLRTSYDSKTL